MHVRKKASLVAALALMGLVTTFGCQGEDAQGGSTSGSSGSSGVTIRLGDGVVDGTTSSQAKTGEPTTLAAGERFSEENLRMVDKFVAQQMKQEKLPSVVVGVWVPGEGEYVLAEGEANLEGGSGRGPGQPFRIASITKTFTATAIL